MRALLSRLALLLRRPGLALALLVATWLAPVDGAGAMPPAPAPALPSAPALALSPAVERLSLDGRYDLLEDADRRFDATHLPGDAQPWHPAAPRGLNIAYSRSAWWLRLRVANADAARPLQRMLELANPRLDAVEWRVLRGGRVAEHVVTGDRLPFATRAIPFHGFAFPLALAPGEQAEVLIRLDSHDGYFGLTPLTLSSDAAFRQGVQLHTLLCGLYYGALLILMLYHLCSMRSSRTAGFALYVAYLAAVVATRVAFEGHAAQYLLPDSPVLANQGLLVSYSLTVALFGALLAVVQKDFLATRPWLRRACWSAIGLDALPIPLALAGSYSGTLRLALPMTFVSIVLGMLVCTAAWRHGHRHARWFMAGGASLMTGLLVERLRFESLLPDWPVLAYAVAITSVLEALLVALALAENVQRLKAQKLSAERAAQAAQVALTEQLGKLVEARTAELAAANQRLSRLASTDELTGAGNRRRFQQEFEAHLRQCRDAGVIGLALFDLDQFKAYNDRYGHPAGDEALRRVVASVQAALRRAEDRLFRIGGEEFALLLTSSDADAMARFVDELRGAVEALGLEHLGNPAGDADGVVTASFGLAWTPAPARDACAPDPMAMYRFADALLYRAKSGGRNRCAIARLVDEGAAAAAPAPAAIED